MSVVITSLAVSLLLTLIFEIGFYFAVKNRTCNKKDLLLLVLVNVITNPVVVSVYWFVRLYTDWNVYLAIVPLEVGAVLVEGWYYKKYGQGFKRPYIFSLFANGFSYGLGFLIQMFI